MKGNKWYMKSVIIAFAVFTCMGYAGCVDDTKDFHVDEETVEPNEFNFSTKKSVDINLAYDVQDGYRVQYEMYTKSPLTLDEYKSYVKDTTLVPFLSGRCDENGKVSFKGELPSSVSEVYVYSFGIGVPTLMRASVSSEGIVSEFETAEVKTGTSTRGASGTVNWPTNNITLHKPALPAVSIQISEEDKKLIDKSFPKDQNYDVVKSYYGSELYLKNSDAHVKIYSVSHAANSNRTNALAYYVYQDEVIRRSDINDKLQLIFPELTKTIPTQGSGFQLLNGTETLFKKGSRIGFALLPDITPGNIKTTNVNLLYSYYGDGSWNAYSYPDLQKTNAPHMVISVLRQDEDGHAIIAISFEDQPWSSTYGTNKGDFRDDIFIVEVDPANSLPDLPVPPTDDKPTYDKEFTSSGILCFEDCWPAKGDYDLNDVVIAYERTVCIKGDGVAALKEKYTFLNNGATYANGFGYHLMGVKQSNVAECTVVSDYTFKGQGWDKTTDEANIMLFDNAKQVKAGTTFSVFTSFIGNVLVTGVNPYIVTAGDFSGLVNLLEQGRIEIHLPTTSTSITKYSPTNKANTSYFGTKDDKSVLDNKIYYVRAGNYPFALELNWNTDVNGGVNNFIIPTEKLSIEKTYPEFEGWVTSNGKKNTDWYYHPNN